MEELHEARKDDRTEFQRDMTVSSSQHLSVVCKTKLKYFLYRVAYLYTTG